MRRTLASSVLGFLLLTSPVFAQTDTQAQIQALLAQIQALQTQLKALQAQTNTLTQQVANFQRNLNFGLTNDNDVRSLQDILKSRGYFSGESTGNYFTLTQDAVKRFQVANGIEPTGFVGPQTRTALFGTIVTPTPVPTPTPTPTPTPVSVGYCSHAAPPQGCYWQGPETYPSCGATLVCAPISTFHSITASLGSSSITVGGTVTGNGLSTSTLSATFNIILSPLGADLTIPVTNPSNLVSYQLLKDGLPLTSTAANTESIYSSTNPLVIPQGTSAVVPVTVMYEGRNRDGSSLPQGLYSIGLTSINTALGNPSSNFTTSAISFPSTSPTPTPTPVSVLNICSHPAPPAGCSYQGVDVYPTCGAQLVCGQSTLLPSPTVNFTSQIGINPMLAGQLDTLYLNVTPTQSTCTIPGITLLPTGVPGYYQALASPNITTTYTASCSYPGSQTSTASVIVKIVPPSSTNVYSGLQTLLNQLSQTLGQQ